MHHLLAHQGGWDEAIFVALPLILFAVLLLVARRRADNLDDGEAGPTDHRPETDASG